MKRMLPALTLALAAACGGADFPIYYRTNCGLIMFEPPPPRPERAELALDVALQPEVIQAVEDAVLARFAGVNDERFRETCNALRGVKLKIRDEEEIWHPTLNRAVLGYAVCPDGWVVIGNGTMDNRARTLAHEMAHQVQRCAPAVCSTTHADVAHGCWDSTGVFDAINAAGAQAIEAYYRRHPSEDRRRVGSLGSAGGIR